jgi:hypothetical protein
MKIISQGIRAQLIGEKRESEKAGIFRKIDPYPTVLYI